jgi:hypothetical protein
MAQLLSDIYHGATAGDIVLAGGLLLLALLYVLTRDEFRRDRRW